ncbi:MAG: beta-(1-6) glucans synthase [Bradyrhizobiaceae bacterium]|nr:MAG: beta-(1-6) glucans synthase [Bradyrhizobiaceae bacterium]
MSLRIPLALLVASLCIIAGVWLWLARPVTLSRAPIDPNQKLECVSYAPFRGDQTPLDPTLHVSAEQIAQDLKELVKITGCIRTYSVDVGLDQVPGEAAKVGLKVIQGIWLGNNRLKNSLQIDTAVALAKKYPDTIQSLVVGNEVLLRGEMTSSDLVALIRQVKAKAGIPVTYADVWEFWLRNRDVYDAVDFVTIHILPFWEDIPVRAKYAAAHVDSIRKRMAVAFPNKEILIGETGWPSAGRMREGALPSRTNQAMVVSQILELARQEKFRVNLIEAYDQPWKRQLEGTVGGYWGLFTSESRTLKYPPGEPITNHPFWKLQMAGGMLLCIIVYVTALLTLRRKPWSPRLVSWLAVALSATAGGALAGLAVEKTMIESLGVAGWTHSLFLLTASLAAPILASIAFMSGRGLPTFLELMGPPEYRTASRSQRLLGLALVIVVLIAAETALGFVFDPRYRDFPFATLTIAAVPFLGLVLLNNPLTAAAHPIAELTFAGLLALSSVYVIFNEGPNNWQSLWTCGAYLALALTLSLARVAQNPKSSAQ